MSLTLSSANTNVRLTRQFQEPSSNSSDTKFFQQHQKNIFNIQESAVQKTEGRYDTKLWEMWHVSCQTIFSI